MSLEHPWPAELAAIIQQIEEGTLDEADADWPAPRDFRVLLKTDKHKTIGDIPDEIERRESCCGLVINRIASLDGEERELLQSNFPGMNLDTVLILEENRTPASFLKSFGIMGGGLVLGLLGVGSIFIGTKRE